MRVLKFQTNRRLVENCPCGKSNKDEKFVPFVGFQDKGFCHSCGETFLPEMEKIVVEKPVKQTPQQFISEELMNSTMRCYDKNSFAKALNFPDEILKEFNIGTAKDGSVIFWLVNELNQICSAKKTQYLSTGKRDKSSFPVHLFKNKEGYKPCLFGLHRLSKYPKDAIVCLVESEKSTMIATEAFPEFCWLASGGSTGLTQSKAFPIRGRKVLVVIDADAAGRKNAPKTVEMLNRLSCSASAVDLSPSSTDGRDIADIILSKNEAEMNYCRFLIDGLIEKL